MALAAATVSAILAGVLVLSSEGAGVLPLAPIRINGNSDLQVGINGVTAGTGSASDLYVISAWDTDAGSSVGICIGNTTAHLLISNVFVHTLDSPPFYAAIHMFNVRADA